MSTDRTGKASRINETCWDGRGDWGSIYSLGGRVTHHQWKKPAGVLGLSICFAKSMPVAFVLVLLPEERERKKNVGSLNLARASLLYAASNKQVISLLATNKA